MRSLLFSIVLIIVYGCQADKSFTIKGEVPNPSFNGEYIYLIPFNYSKDKVDSAIIINTSFTFNGITDSVGIYVLRAQKPLSRFDLQDLLVVNEPGVINVKLNENSSANGTALNDSLQHWKDSKTLIDSYIANNADAYQEADSIKRSEIKRQSDSLTIIKNNFHFRFVKNNKDNIIGEFVFRIMKSTFTDQQIEEIERH